MNDLLWKPVLDVLTSGPGSAPLSRILDVAAFISSAPSCALLVQDGHNHLVIAARGCASLKRGASYPGSKAFDAVFNGPVELCDPRQLAKIQRSPGLPPWRWAAAVPVPLPEMPFDVALVCADTRSSRQRDAGTLCRLGQLAALAADEIGLASMLAEQSARIDTLLAQLPLEDQRFAHSPGAALSAPVVAALQAPAVQAPGTDAHAVVDFLDSTLIPSVRLLTRHQIGYHAVRRWRSPLKKWQLLALKSLKQSRDSTLVDLAANELTATARKLFGGGAFDAVAAVPCGNSGPECISRRLAAAVALRLGISELDAFCDITVSGSSHPRRNPARPKMRLRCKPGGSILLVDDVATSGAHIVEATAALRSGAASVSPLVWLADG